MSASFGANCKYCGHYSFIKEVGQLQDGHKSKESYQCGYCNKEIGEKGTCATWQSQHNQTKCEKCKENTEFKTSEKYARKSESQ